MVDEAIGRTTFFLFLKIPSEWNGSIAERRSKTRDWDEYRYNVSLEGKKKKASDE